MAIPGIYDLTLPVLRALSDGDVHTTGQMTAVLASELHVSDVELERARPDGRPLFQNRVQWARTYLKKSGLVEYPEPCASRITAKGLQLLACDPRQLGPEFFKGPKDSIAPVASPSHNPTSCGTLEEELRALIGDAVASDESWDIICRLNGWGPFPPATYRQIAKETGRDQREILSLGRSCRRPHPKQAPMLDSALRLTLERQDQDPEQLAFTLAQLGITGGAFCIAGLSEAARRFGRTDDWIALVRQLSLNRSKTARPRPFDSWFEIDVFLYVTGLGHKVIPQKRIGNYRVDLLLPDFVPQLVIECDGDRFHGPDRLYADEVREAELLKRGYHLLRFSYSDFLAKPHAIKSGLVEILSRPESIGLQLRAG